MFSHPWSAVTFETQLYEKTKLKTLCKWHYVRIFVRFANFMSRIERVEGLRRPGVVNKSFDYVSSVVVWLKIYVCASIIFFIN